MDESELERKAEAYIPRFFASYGRKRVEEKWAGAALAKELRTRAIDLCHNKATDLSPSVKRLFDLAARVALLAYWPDEELLAKYEKELSDTREYERFRRDYIESP
jgi:hypothetical protein